MQLEKPKAFRKKLIVWYQSHARDLPWRRTKDPYKIWVSEIMLQQTQVETVIPYYRRWLKRFPTLQSLAAADLSEVMKQWAGLGYYRRARMLHEGAKILLKISSGKVPEDVEQLLKLPGIGRYTAGAISSIAFGRKAPILDGNVVRILTRLEAISSDIGSTKTVARLWKLSQSLLPDQNPGNFNQAMMELGATLCLPENPRCGLCPVSSFCTAHQRGWETRYPVKKRKESIEKAHSVALILVRSGRVLIRKQPTSGRWGGLWMFPFWKNRRSMLQHIEKTAGCSHKGVSRVKRRLTVHHGFTKYRIRLDVYEYNLNFMNSVTRSSRPHSRWVRIQELPKLAFPSPHQKIVRELIKSDD